jgi:hypothetical protein
MHLRPCCGVAIQQRRFSRGLFWLVICNHRQPPADCPLLLCVLVVVLRRQRMSMSRDILAPAPETTVDVGVGSDGARSVRLIENVAGVLREKENVFVPSHSTALS